LIVECTKNLNNFPHFDSIENVLYFEKALKSQAYFYKVIESIPFDKYLEDFTIGKIDLKCKTSLNNPKRQKYNAEELSGAKNKCENVLRLFSDAVCDSEVIELITNKFLDNLKHE
jgi:hypothetical protein